MSEAISIEDQKVPATEVFEKEGYKKTKLGWIPEEWSVKSLGEIGVFSKGKGISKSEITETGLPCLRYAEIYTKYNNYVYCFNSFINRNSAQNSRTIESGDILFSGSGETLEDIGKCIAYLGEEISYAGGDIIILKPKSENSKYLSFVLNHSVANKQKHKLGQGHSVVHIYSSSLKNLKIPLPPQPEQEKIAAILSTWDNAIGKQEQLIAAKKHFKKGLMQQLLTGKKRFPGFSGQWKVKPLGEVCEIKGDYGINAASVPFNSKLPTYLRITDIDENGNFQFENKTSVNNLYSKNFYLEEGDIVFARTGASVGKTYLHKAENGKLVFAGFLIRFRTNPNKLMPYFLRQYVNSNKYWNWVRVFSVRSGQPGINSKEYAILPIPIPPISEQKKISNVFKIIEKEIAILQNQLTQLKTQKRGLMQKLLTGEVRVKI